MDLRIGTSGYQYRHWRGVLYPPEGPARDWFACYAARFDTVEINATFYRLPAASTFEAWKGRAPAGFLHALKFSRYGTHLRRLRDPEATVGLFAGRARLLGSSLGPVLVQLPPRWRPVPERLADFLEAAPRDLRWAFEFRDPGWLAPGVLALLERWGAGLCVHDRIPDHPDRPTAGWVYLRYHGQVPGGSYSAARLRREARRIDAWLAQGLDVYAYFNNDAHGHAVRNALALRRMVAGPGRPAGRARAAS